MLRVLKRAGFDFVLSFSLVWDGHDEDILNEARITNKLCAWQRRTVDRCGGRQKKCRR
jgi:hypothetical protein